MASLGHIAIGMAAARVDTPREPELARLALRMVGWSVLSLLPDADVVGFAFGVRYADAWGHRGATHSMSFALAIAALIGLLTRRWRTTLLGFAVVASHGLLDTLTDGGLGAALLWPWSPARLFAPWRPIPVAPIGAGFLSLRGLYCALVESLAFAPFWLWALWPRRPPRDGADVGPARRA